ncbi:metallopeptidase TldD-related protein [Streptomyces sp. ID05-04B]|uniref:metallopeptidase TldD-related protein n=1 Tax=unclassified Streptomyces TaxID=2593676 RepID=UPI00131EFAC4|nr:MULTISPECIES: metallopeptidase TldD-related protein [unclassified Streptomyces]MDX5565511.1 metallopeptidase TldD-related protein [Streptomyces sp. ID05-04B]
MSDGIRALIAEAARQAADCEVWTAHRETEEVVCRGGAVERRSDVESGVTAVTVWRDGGEGYAVRALPDSDDPSLVRSALEVARALPGRLPPPPAADPPAPPGTARAATSPALDDRTSPARDEKTSPALDEKTVHAVRELSTAAPGLDIELRVKAERSTVRLGRPGHEPRGYRTGLVQLQARVTASASGTGFVAHQMYGSAAEDVLARAADVDLPEICALAAVLAGPPADVWEHDDVLLTGWVAVKLLSLVLPAFQWDTAVEGRSPLAGRWGESVCADGVDLVDDPTSAEYPLAAPWDDEGTPTKAVELVRDGRLRAFLGHRHSTRSAGAGRAGSGWRGAAGEMPRVQPSHLSLRVGRALGDVPRPGRRLLRVVQANGVHTSNGITGDFSIGANALLEDPDGTRHNAGNITVAGNVFDLLRQIEGHNGTVRTNRSHTSFVACPGLWVRGLTVGR